MICECPSGDICFSKYDLTTWAIKGCIKQTLVISPIDIDWVYIINKDGLCIYRDNLHMIIDDPNMSKDVKKQIQNIFPHLK